MADSTATEKYVEIDGRRLAIRKVGPEMIPEIKARVLATRKNAFASGIDQATLSQFDDDTKALIVREALKQASQPVVTMQDIETFLKSIDGAAYGLWLALRDNGPDITLEYVTGLLARDEVKQAIDAKE